MQLVSFKVTTKSVQSSPQAFTYEGQHNYSWC